MADDTRRADLLVNGLPEGGDKDQKWPRTQLVVVAGPVLPLIPSTVSSSREGWQNTATLYTRQMGRVLSAD